MISFMGAGAEEVSGSGSCCWLEREVKGAGIGNLEGWSILDKGISTCGSTVKDSACFDEWWFVCFEENPRKGKATGQNRTSRERPKSALYLRLKNVKGGLFGFCETPAGGKIWKKWIEQCHSVEKCKWGDPLGFVKLQLFWKYEKNWRGDHLRTEKKCPKKI